MGKDKYRVRNWHQYNEGLGQRGSLTIWISEEALEQWRFSGKQQRGGQVLYSDLAIETCLTLRLIYHLPLRQTEGFVVSIFGQAHLELPVPDSSTLCRRSKTLAVELKTKSGKPATDIVLDATGLKVFGKGEWKVRKHGYCKHRTWMKLHVALDPQDQQVWAVELSTNSVDDAQIVKPLLQAVPCTINSVTGDGAYDKVKVREQLCRRAAEQKEDILQLMCLQKNAIPDVKHRDCTRQRDEDIKAIRRLGKRQWKVLSGYLRRSLAETFMFRYKVILGDHLKGRTFENQQTEVKLGARILNLMLETAKPKSERVA